MWILFDEQGGLIEQLTHGPDARVGSTNFQLFAVFEDLNISDYYTEATIRFRRPDLQGSEYPQLFMNRTTLTFHKLSSDSDSTYFQDNEKYQGYLFDFGNFTEDEDVITLLDTPGLWEVTITLIGDNRERNVVGLITFNVQESVSEVDEEPEELDPGQLMSNIATRLIKKIDKESLEYWRICVGFEQAAEEGTLLKSTFVKNCYVYDPSVDTLYKILDVQDTEPVSAFVFATYKKYPASYFNIGNGELTLKVNGKEAGAFNADEHNDVEVDLGNFVPRYVINNPNTVTLQQLYNNLKDNGDEPFVMSMSYTGHFINCIAHFYDFGPFVRLHFMLLTATSTAKAYYINVTNNASQSVFDTVWNRYNCTALNFDSEVSQNSENFITSGGVWSAIESSKTGFADSFSDLDITSGNAFLPSGLENKTIQIQVDSNINSGGINYRHYISGFINNTSNRHYENIVGTIFANGAQLEMIARFEETNSHIDDQWVLTISCILYCRFIKLPSGVSGTPTNEWTKLSDMKADSTMNSWLTALGLGTITLKYRII